MANLLKIPGSGCILILCFFLIVSGCTQAGRDPVNTTTPAVTGSPAIPPSALSETTIPPTIMEIQPPAGAVSAYKGVWMPRAFSDEQYRYQPMDSAELEEQLGSNIILVGIPIYIDKNGNIATRASSDKIERRIRELTTTYYPKGIRIGLIVISQYSDQTFTPGQPPDKGSLPSGGATPFSKDLLENPRYFDNYNKMVGELAVLAERYNLEMFSPMNEPDHLLGSALASQWGQDILPDVKKNYSGRVLYRVALGPGFSGSLNTTGYDIIGVTVSPRSSTSGNDLENYPHELSEKLTTVNGWADRDHVPEIMFGEIWFGFGTDTEGDDYKIQAVRDVFAAGKDRSKGYIFYDPYPEREYQFVGTKWFDEVALQFRKNT